MKAQFVMALAISLITTAGFAVQNTQSTQSLTLVGEKVATVAKGGNGSGRGIGNGSGRGIGNGSGRGIGNGRGRVIGFSEARN